MPQDSATGQVGRRLLFVDNPDRRALQGVLMLMLGVDVALRAVAGHVPLVSWPAFAALLAGLVTVAVFVLPWAQLPRWVSVAVPLVDLAAIGLIRLDPEGSGAASALVVSILWLGGQFGRQGALLCGLGTLAFIGLPTVLYFGAAPATLAQALLFPLCAGYGALAIAVGLERMRAGLDQAEADRGELSEALALIEHQRRFADAILDTVDVGLVLLDRTGAYQSMNRRHGDFMRLAYPDGHAGRAGQVGLVYADDGTTPLAREEMPTYRAANGEEFDDCRIWVGDDPLTKRALSVSARTVRDADGQFGGAALAYKDVTDFMRALRVKDEFVASVSHELRTPLTSVMGYVDLLLDEPAELSADQTSHLEVIARNADRLRRLVTDLLHTSRVDGPMHVVRTRTDLAVIVGDSVQAARPTASSAGLTLELESPESLSVMVDAQRMAQVVDNLISNAIKFTPSGGAVHVCLAVDGKRVELEVTDTGIGIEAHDRERLFTRFFRAREAEERSIQGVGLGLSIAKSIVESHGGRIEFESTVGNGTVFRVRLPLEVDEGSASE